MEPARVTCESAIASRDSPSPVQRTPDFHASTPAQFKVRQVSRPRGHLLQAVQSKYIPVGSCTESPFYQASRVTSHPPNPASLAMSVAVSVLPLLKTFTLQDSRFCEQETHSIPQSSIAFVTDGGGTRRNKGNTECSSGSNVRIRPEWRMTYGRGMVTHHTIRIGNRLALPLSEWLMVR